MNLKAKFMGQLDFTLNEKSITTSLSKKARGVLCYLMMNSAKTHYRDHISNVFWENHEKSSANSNLRYILWTIRKAIECNDQDVKYIISPNKNTLKFAGNSEYVVDVFQFKNCIKRANEVNIDATSRINLLEEASNLYSGVFLENFYLEDAPILNDWIFYEREELQRLYFELQISLSNEYKNLKDYDKSIISIKKLLKIDPLHEELYYHLMTVYSLSGQRTAAINSFYQLKKILREELNISPMMETQALYQQIVLEQKSISPAFIQTIEKNKENQILSFGKNGVHIKFFITSTKQKSDEIKVSLKNITANNKDITIEITKLPGKRIPYEGVYEIMEQCIEILCHQKSKSSANKLISQINIIKKTYPIEQYLFFQAICDVLQNLNLDKLLINIYHLHLLDDKTIEFISFLSRKCKNTDINIIGMYDSTWQHPSFQLFNKAFQHEENAEFIIC